MITAISFTLILKGIIMKNSMSLKIGITLWVSTIVLLVVLSSCSSNLETPRTYLNPDRANECLQPGNEIPPLPLDECLKAREERKHVS